MLTAAVEGSAPFPDELRERVARASGAPAEVVDAALKRQAAPALAAVQTALASRAEQVCTHSAPDFCTPPQHLLSASLLCIRPVHPSSAEAATGRARR